ncbi:MAG: hypothetical protein ACXWI5_05025 [Croceibacterium sp.]
MIDVGFAIYGGLVVAVLGLAVFADARRRARRRAAEAAEFSKTFSQ